MIHSSVQKNVIRGFEFLVHFFVFESGKIVQIFANIKMHSITFFSTD